MAETDGRTAARQLAELMNVVRDAEFAEDVENPMVGDEQLGLWSEPKAFTPVHPARWTQNVRVNKEYL